MKKYLLLCVLLIGTLSSCDTLEAQSIGVSVNINIGRQPAWGPVGYDYVDYYYFPDINCYFNVNLNLFYFLDRGRWIGARYLPFAYSSYDLYGMYKVVLVGVTDPWRNNRIHIRDFGRYKGFRTQPIIRDSRDIRYNDSRNNRIAWYSESNRKNDNRNGVYRNNNNGNNGNYNSRQDGNNNNRRSQGVDNNRYNNNNYNNNNYNNNNRNGINNKSNNNNNNNIIEKGNNIERRDNNIRQQNNNENREPQKNSENRSFSGRNDNERNNSGSFRSGSSERDRSHGNEGRGSGEKRGRR